MPRFTASNPSSLLAFLKKKLPGWKTPTIKQRLKNDLIVVNGSPVRSGAERLEAGDTVEVLAIPPRAESYLPTGLGEPPLAILHADDSIIAVDKPSGLLSVASERERNLTAIRIMRDWLQGLDHQPDRELHAAHRLDREASGVLLLARSMAVKKALAAKWSTYEKTYAAVVDGIPSEPEGTIDAPLWEDKGLFVRVAKYGDGTSALTHYRVVRQRGRRSLLQVKLGTGRKHQIRVHLAHIGCPIVGDLRYGASKAPRLALHAERLKIYHPADGREITFVAPIPKEFQRFLRS